VRNCTGGNGDSRNLSFGLRFKTRNSRIQVKGLRQLSRSCNLRVRGYEVYILLSRYCLKKIIPDNTGLLLSFGYVLKSCFL
jgi:hypothetical protein